jgi:thiamine kinase-like enzyme
VDASALGEQAQVFKRQPPWILSIHETNPMYMNQVSQGNSQLLQLLQQYPEFQTALTAIKAGWTYSALIHGDIKFENLMLSQATPDATPQLKIIDWEIADIGDECWDVGGAIQAYLTFWIFSLPLDEGVSIEQAAEASPFNKEEIAPALAAFWRKYAECRKLDENAARNMLVRCMSCAAARMIQTAYESLQMTPQVTPHALCKLQMSMNILRDPAGAIRELMGLY